MPRIIANRLTVRTVASLKDGVFGDGGNLWLTIRGDTRAWTVRYKSPVTFKAREMGLGSARDVSLAEARNRAREARLLVLAGSDPLEQRRAQRAAVRKAAALTFRQVSESYIKERTPAWRDVRSPGVWRSSLIQHAFPVLADRPMTAIDTDAVLAVLRPIWTTKTETAGRVRGRLERIIDYARTHGWCDGENPARWRGHLDNILPAPSKVAKVEHHAAIERGDIGRVMAALTAARGIAAKAVRFACLTAARSGEVRCATWPEIDLQAKVWIVPAARMKTGREHRVPLTDAVLAILNEVNPLRRPDQGDLIFPGQKVGRPMSDVALSKALHLAAGTSDVTVHGLRSTFRDWVSEETDFPREAAEMALAHVIGDRVEAAYRRGDLFAKRREMMEAWASTATPIASKNHAPSNPTESPLLPSLSLDGHQID